MLNEIDKELSPENKSRDIGLNGEEEKAWLSQSPNGLLQHPKVHVPNGELTLHYVR